MFRYNRSKVKKKFSQQWQTYVFFLETDIYERYMNNNSSSSHPTVSMPKNVSVSSLHLHKTFPFNGNSRLTWQNNFEDLTDKVCNFAICPIIFGWPRMYKLQAWRKTVIKVARSGFFLMFNSVVTLTLLPQTLSYKLLAVEADQWPRFWAKKV